MTPGTYLRLRREAAGMSIDDLALMTETDPHVCARDRGEYLRAIEDGTMKLGDEGVTLQLTPFAAQQRFPFDPQVLAELVAIEGGLTTVSPELCRRCGCSWFDPCLDQGAHGCAWSADDKTLCTSCVVADAEAGFIRSARPARLGTAA